MKRHTQISNELLHNIEGYIQDAKTDCAQQLYNYEFIDTLLAQENFNILKQIDVRAKYNVDTNKFVNTMRKQDFTKANSYIKKLSEVINIKL